MSIQWSVVTLGITFGAMRTDTEGSSGANGDALPEDLLAAIAAAGGRRVVLVTGAGCSKEPPTGLPLADELAIRCHRELIDNRVLSPGDCTDPKDLSSVADAVFKKKETQKPLVDCFPPSRFEHAEPNEGHQLAAGLLREGAISCILTLNFDLAFSAALTQVSAGGDVTTIRRPADYDRMGPLSLVYLHRPISSPADDLILRRDEIEKDWQGGWEEAVAQRVVGGPVTVFVGLGTPAAVLIETTKRIREKIADRAKVYVVDPCPREESAFFGELDLDSGAYVQLPWTEFMRRLAERVVKSHRWAIEKQCEDLIERNNWPQEAFEGVCERVTSLGLLRMGRIRARWMLRSESYAPQPHDEEALRLLGELIVAIAMIERLTGMAASFDEEAVVEFSSEKRRVLVLLGSGGGSLGWSAVATGLHGQRSRFPATNQPTRALVGGMPERSDAVSTPPSIAGSRRAESLVVGSDQLLFLTTAEIRDDPSLVWELVA